MLELSRNEIIQKSIQESDSIHLPLQASSTSETLHTSRFLERMEEDYRVSAPRSMTIFFSPEVIKILSAQFEQYSGGHILGTLIPKKAQIKAVKTKRGIQESRLAQATCL